MGLSDSQSFDLQLGLILVLTPIGFISRSDPIKSRNPSSPALHLNVTRLVPLDGLNRIPARRCIQWRFFPGTGPTEGFMSWVAPYMKCLSISIFIVVGKCCFSVHLSKVDIRYQCSSLKKFPMMSTTGFVLCRWSVSLFGVHRATVAVTKLVNVKTP